MIRIKLCNSNGVKLYESSIYELLPTLLFLGNPTLPQSPLLSPTPATELTLVTPLLTQLLPTLPLGSYLPATSPVFLGLISLFLRPSMFQKKGGSLGICSRTAMKMIKQVKLMKVL